jgi:bifunctional DNA-binding transcriptional regulator/antitoxin component of YhaV-PrlF toxin-antitoxin module
MAGTFTRVKRRNGYTRLSSKHQVTIPVAVLAQVGAKPGDEFRVEASDDGRIVLAPERSLAERRLEAIDRIAGTYAGVYPPGYLDELRDEWR